MQTAQFFRLIDLWLESVGLWPYHITENITTVS